MQLIPSNRCIIVTTSDITSMSTFVQDTNLQQIKWSDSYAAILWGLPHLGLSKSKNFSREQINAAFFLFCTCVSVLWEMKKRNSIKFAVQFSVFWPSQMKTHWTYFMWICLIGNYTNSATKWFDFCHKISRSLLNVMMFLGVW